MKRGKRGKYIWETKDIVFLKMNYKQMTNQELADALGIKMNRCRKKIYELGLQRYRMEYWTKEQVQFLLDNFKELGGVELAEILQENNPKKKGWHKNHINKKMAQLGLKRTPEDYQKIIERNIKNGRHTGAKSWPSRRRNKKWESYNDFAKELGYKNLAEAFFALGRETFKQKYDEANEIGQVA
ncbi:hypothetical protein [Maribacter flavus]|uniref:Uncharacterized protein n=1 Tax=Maribacter flavus TaxID=1658664 RepID=A0A5B2TXB9_9FLAO|nr:hypothetical protein [Maribacter flavus]KAA2218280.1 hypothetical protein F0361_01270 [Maribacter flavus]